MGYQAGRGLAYLSLGVLAGSIGGAVPFWLLFIILASGIALSASNAKRLPSVHRLRARLQSHAAASPLLLGLASGILPCGLLHGWLAAAAATRSPVHGALLLGMLWIGTIPALEIGPTLLGRPIVALRKRFPRAVPLAFILLAMIPLTQRLSLSAVPGGAPSCHHHNQPGQ